MSAVLESIREELRSARRWVAALEQSEALLAPIYEAGEPRPPAGASPPVTRASRRRPGRAAGANPSREVIRTCIYEHGPISRGELLARLGGRASALDKKLHRMLELGEIAAGGSPRLYTRPASPPARSQSHAPAAAAAIEATATPRPEIGRYPVYDALHEAGSATTTQLMARTGLTSSVVFAQARELTRLGLVAFRGHASKRVWYPRPTATDSPTARILEVPS